MVGLYNVSTHSRQTVNKPNKQTNQILLWLCKNSSYFDLKLLDWLLKGKKKQIPHRDLHSPQLASEFTGHLHGNLGGQSHHHSLFIQGPNKYTLARDWKVGTQIFFNGTIIVLLIRRQNTHYLREREKKIIYLCLAFKKYMTTWILQTSFALEFLSSKHEHAYIPLNFQMAFKSLTINHRPFEMPSHQLLTQPSLSLILPISLGFPFLLTSLLMSFC